MRRRSGSVGGRGGQPPRSTRPMPPLTAPDRPRDQLSEESRSAKMAWRAVGSTKNPWAIRS